MSSLPPITDHAFWRLVRERYDANADRSTPEIAAEIGCTAEELVRWVLAYKGPKKSKSVDNSKYGPAIAPREPSDDARKFAAYRRATYAGAPRAGQRA